MPKYQKFEELPVWQEAGGSTTLRWICSKRPIVRSVPDFAINSIAPRFPSRTISRKDLSALPQPSCYIFSALLAGRLVRCVR